MPSLRFASPPRLPSVIYAASLLFLLAIFTGCDQGLPENDPDALRAEIVERMAEAPYPTRGAIWLIYIADDETTGTRDLMMDVMHRPTTDSKMATFLLERFWIEDPEVRAAIRDAYMDPDRVWLHRVENYFNVIKPNAEEYPEFAELPPEPPMKAGVPRIVGFTP